MSLDEYLQFGRSGIRVSPVALGAMTFGSNSGFGVDFEESRKVFDHYYEQGGNFVDTANVYSNGDSERYLGDLISDKRSDIVLASKYTANPKVGAKFAGLEPGRINPNGGSGRRSLAESIDASLKRLRTGALDILYMHVFDWSTPIEETMRALDDVVRSGKAHYVAISGSPSWVVARANTIAELRGWTQFVGLQTKYSLLERSYEYDLLPIAAEFGMATVPWGILDSGFLTGKYERSTAKDLQVTSLRTAIVKKQTEDDKNWEILDEVKAIAQEIGRTPAQVATNWTLQRPGITSILAGARTVDQLQGNLQALEFTLTPEQIARLDTVSKPDSRCIPFTAREFMNGGWEQTFQAGKSKPAPRFQFTLGC
ncbi:aldo/keto reductase [Linderina pennispora]|uniref:Aldo/keto reductase n=1 Tax=Linderina pennispora TaxID=61395 RepID=A0A1Y1WBN5_9FUNG|nr:aldo/keto reductase [Linderina pennispora]ORX70943.1 aldo/keto reductase [Linderina pennispora]